MKLSINKVLIGLVLIAAYLIYSFAAGHSNFFTRHITYQRQRAQAKIKIIELNYLIPSFKPLVDFTQGLVKFNSGEWNPYTAYYEKIVEIMPARFDAHLFLGYCYFYQGHQDHAEASFQKAVMLNPHFFWGFYDLGVLAGRKGDCTAAASAFGQALNFPVQETVESLMGSKLYLDVAREAANFGPRLEQNLKTSYAQAYTLGAMADRCRRGEWNMAQSLRQLAEHTQIQVF